MQLDDVVSYTGPFVLHHGAVLFQRFVVDADCGTGSTK